MIRLMIILFQCCVVGGLVATIILAFGMLRGWPWPAPLALGFTLGTAAGGAFGWWFLAPYGGER